MQRVRLDLVFNLNSQRTSIPSLVAWANACFTAGAGAEAKAEDEEVEENENGEYMSHSKETSQYYY